MRHFVTELEQLEELVLDMAADVEAAIHQSVTAVLEKDESLARQVIAGERQVNRREMQIDETATRLLALNQPVARDLRLLTAVIKMNSDLERMGDLATNIAQRALSLSRQAARTDIVDIALLANRVQHMVSKSLQSFASREEELAREVLTADEEVDQFRNAAYRTLVAHMEAHPERARQDVDILFVVHSLERIADHATNLAEDVLLVIKGIDVRHQVNA